MPSSKRKSFRSSIMGGKWLLPRNPLAAADKLPVKFEHNLNKLLGMFAKSKRRLRK